MGVLAYLHVLPFCRIVMFHMKIISSNGQARYAKPLASTRDANRTNLGVVLVVVAAGVYVVVLASCGV
jgi:hypothetical protein